MRKKIEKHQVQSVPYPRVRVCYLPQPHSGGCVIVIRFFGDMHSIKYTTIKKNIFNTKLAAAFMKHMIETTI